MSYNVSTIVDRTGRTSEDFPLVLLWGVVGLTLVGDVVTTLYGMHIGLTEGNPVIDGLIHNYGPGAFILFKIVVAGCAALYARRLENRLHRMIAPLCIAFPWALATTSNIVLIASIS